MNNPSRAGYTFTGWTGSNGSVPQTEVKVVKGSTGNKSYTANWSIINYEIRYDLNGGTVSKANPSNYTIETADITLNNPTKTGYNFKGWSGTGLVGDTNLTVKIAKGSRGDKVFVANWKIIEYKITYTLNGGNVSTSNVSSYNIESSNITLNKPIKTGYIFTGWTGSNGTSPQTEVTIISGSTGDRSYTANWKPITYTIIFNGNGATSGSMEDLTAVYDLSLIHI